MNRAAGVTLGGLILLGSASTARADDPAVFDWPSIASAGYGVFSRVPENWSDLPVQLKVSESIGYNSNVFSNPINGGALYGVPVSSWESVTTLGAGTKAYWEGQQFFANGSLGMYRYLSVQDLDILTSTFNAGVNWTLGSKCTGTLTVSEATQPSQPGQQVGFNVKNTATTIAGNETANCIISGQYGWVLNSGATETTNSAAVDQFNNYQSVFIAAGIGYSVAQTNSLQFLATVTGYSYTDRAIVLNTQGLASNITEDEFNLIYTKNINPNLSYTLSGALVGVRNSSFSLAPASGWQPTYSLAVAWAPTPKLGLTATVAKVVAPPTSILANLQVTENATLGLTYNLTPKMLFASQLQIGHSSGGFQGENGVSTLSSVFEPLTANTDYYSANASINYTITPFITANLSYTYSRSVQAGFVTPTNEVLLALTYSPY